MQSRARARAVVAVILAASALVACSSTPDLTTGPSVPPGITAPPPTTPASPTPEVSSELPAEIAGVDTTDWQQIAVPSGAATFRIPADWSTTETDGGLDLLRPDGQRQLLYRENPDTGEGRCLDASGTAVAWRTSNLDRQDVAQLPGTAFGAAALQLGEQWIVSVGLRPTADAQSPRCPIVNAFETGGTTIGFGSEVLVDGGGEAAPWQVASVADGEAYLSDPEYATIRAILMSLELQS